MRRVLNQCANAAVRVKGSIFEIVYRRLVPRLGHNQTIAAIAHQLCRPIWRTLHQGIRYEERGGAVHERSKRARTARMIRQLRSLGYRVQPLTVQLQSSMRPGAGFSTLLQDNRAASERPDHLWPKFDGASPCKDLHLIYLVNIDN